jgi:signal transduction histidine kinase
VENIYLDKPVSAISPGMEHLIQVVQELSLARDMDSVMRIVRTAARKLTGADGATFVLRDHDKCYYADEDAISPLWKGSRFPLATCISGWAMMNRKAVAIEDIYADDRIPHDAYKPTFVKSLAMVPIRTLEPIGAIGNYWARHHAPSAHELKLLQSLADITAVTIENVRVYAELEQRVKERTADLEAANKSLEAFSHSVSHDLRAPLRSIKGLLELLYESLGSKVNDHERVTSARIVAGVNRMDQLIVGLLDFSRMGKQKLRKSHVPMKAMVDEICANYLEQEESGRVIEFSVAALPDAEADVTLIRQVWQNLLSNAVKYTSKKAVAHIEVGFQLTDDHIVYFVRDDGAGFDMAYATELFGVFKRMHTVREFEGIGIGLSLAERIVTRHDGKIWADARVDQGATFYFTLPKK